MTERYVSTITEDEVGDAVVRRLLSAHAGRLAIYTSRVTGGFGQIKVNIGAFNNAAKALPQIVLTDLDKGICAPDLIFDWLDAHTKHKDLMFRVAVREIEAWLLGDRAGVARFLGVAVTLVPGMPESLADPKAELINIARRCRDRRLRQAIVPFGTAPIGPDYNAVVGRFVSDHWNPNVAAAECPSLMKTVQRIAELAAEPWPAL